MMLRFARHANKHLRRPRVMRPSPYRVGDRVPRGRRRTGRRVGLRPRCTCMAARAAEAGLQARGRALRRGSQARPRASSPPTRAACGRARRAEEERLPRQRPRPRSYGPRHRADRDARARARWRLRTPWPTRSARAGVPHVSGELLREYKLRRLSARALDLADLLDKAVTSRKARARREHVRRALRRPLAHLAEDRPLDRRRAARRSPRRGARRQDLAQGGARADRGPRSRRVRLPRLDDERRLRHPREPLRRRGRRGRASAARRPLQREADRPGDDGALHRAEVEPRGALHAGRAGEPPGPGLRAATPRDHRPRRRAPDRRRGARRAGGARAARRPCGARGAPVEHRRDVFAPERLPVAVRVDALVARGDRLQAVDVGARGSRFTCRSPPSSRRGSARSSATPSSSCSSVMSGSRRRSRRCSRARSW